MKSVSKTWFWLVQVMIKSKIKIKIKSKTGNEWEGIRKFGTGHNPNPTLIG